MEYNDLKEKIRGPIRVARDVVIHQTLSDRFLQVFAEQVNLNAPYQKPHDMVRISCSYLNFSDAFDKKISSSYNSPRF